MQARTGNLYLPPLHSGMQAETAYTMSAKMQTAAAQTYLHDKTSIFGLLFLESSDAGLLYSS